MNEISDREIKIEAIKKLLEFSLLFLPKDKKRLLEVLPAFQDSEIEGLGKVLAVEHNMRDSLDNDFAKDFLIDLANKIEIYSKK